MSVGTTIKGLWTYEQTAEYLGSTANDSISIRSIMRLCQQGKLRRVYPMPKKPRIDPNSVHEYIANLLAQQYDDSAQDGGCMKGGQQWLKSTPVQTRPIGGRDTSHRMAAKLDALLKSKKPRDSRR